MLEITMIPGDGIGPEISRAAMAILDHAGVEIAWDVQQAGEAVYRKTGELIPEAVFQSLERTKLALKGPMTTPIGSGFRSLNVALRKKYDLYANVRPVVSIGSFETLFEHVNLVIFRENTEDLYAGIEEDISPNEKRSIKVITREGSRRIAQRAFEYAQKTGRKKVTVVTKANIMKLTDGLFLEVARQVAKDYPGISLEEVLVDNMCMQLVMRPQNYEVILTENLYGDILSDLCAGLVGGLGLIPGANLGDEMAIFEAVHGSAPDIAGKNLANPTALTLSGVLLLEHARYFDEAQRVRKALDQTLRNPRHWTRDLGGEETTEGFAQAVIEALEKI